MIEFEGLFILGKYTKYQISWRSVTEAVFWGYKAVLCWQDILNSVWIFFANILFPFPKHLLWVFRSCLSWNLTFYCCVSAALKKVGLFWSWKCGGVFFFLNCCRFWGAVAKDVVWRLNWQCTGWGHQPWLSSGIRVEPWPGNTWANFPKLIWNIKFIWLVLAPRFPKW